MSAMPETRPVVVIGDLIVDELVETMPDGQRSITYPGGAGCNVAIDLVALGTPAILLAEVGDDPAGQELRRIVGERGVDLRPLSTSRPTGWATSSRIDGEPTYAFAGSVCDRRFAVSTEIAEELGPGRLLVVATFPFDDADQVDDLLALAADGGHRLMVDPNPRPQLLRDPAAFRTGFLRVAAESAVVKLSEQDHAVLDLPSSHEWCEGLFASGVEAVVVTRGAAGIRVDLPEGAAVEMRIPSGPPAVDAMGAGDAVLAVLAASVSEAGSPGEVVWPTVLDRAVAFAARIVAEPGGHSDVVPITPPPRARIPENAAPHPRTR